MPTRLAIFTAWCLLLNWQLVVANKECSDQGDLPLDGTFLWANVSRNTSSCPWYLPQYFSCSCQWKVPQHPRYPYNGLPDQRKFVILIDKFISAHNSCLVVRNETQNLKTICNKGPNQKLRVVEVLPIYTSTYIDFNGYEKDYFHGRFNRVNGENISECNYQTIAGNDKTWNSTQIIANITDAKFYYCKITLDNLNEKPFLIKWKSGQLNVNDSIVVNIFSSNNTVLASEVYKADTPISFSDLPLKYSTVGVKYSFGILVRNVKSNTSATIFEVQSKNTDNLCGSIKSNSDQTGSSSLTSFYSDSNNLFKNPNRSITCQWNLGKQTVLVNFTELVLKDKNECVSVRVGETLVKKFCGKFDKNYTDDRVFKGNNVNIQLNFTSNLAHVGYFKLTFANISAMSTTEDRGKPPLTTQAADYGSTTDAVKTGSNAALVAVLVTVGVVMLVSFAGLALYLKKRRG